MRISMRYFEHDDTKPVLSVLLPSRKRLVGLQKAIDSLAETVSDKRNVEVIVKLDHDDTESCSRINEIVTDINVNDIKGSFQGNGFKDEYKYK